MIALIKDMFFNNSYSIAFTVAMIVIGLFVSNHFWDEWREDVAATKVTETVIKTAELEKDNQNQLKKEVENDVKKVGTNDIYDLIN